MKLRFSTDWLHHKIASDPEMDCDAGVLHPEAPQKRFFIDHGLIHDRKTGKHIETGEEGEWHGSGTQSVCDLLNELTAAPLPPSPSSASRDSRASSDELARLREENERLRQKNRENVQIDEELQAERRRLREENRRLGAINALLGRDRDRFITERDQLRSANDALTTERNRLEAIVGTGPIKTINNNHKRIATLEAANDALRARVEATRDLLKRAANCIGVLKRFGSKIAAHALGRELFESMAEWLAEYAALATPPQGNPQDAAQDREQEGSK